jgi:hypothetical protein
MKTVTWSQFHTADLQTSGSTIQNIVTWDLCTLVCGSTWVVHKAQELRISFTKMRPYGKWSTYAWKHVMYTCKCCHQMGVYIQKRTCISSANIFVLVTLFGNGSSYRETVIVHKNCRFSQQKCTTVLCGAVQIIGWFFFRTRWVQAFRSGRVTTANMLCIGHRMCSHRHVSGRNWTVHGWRQALVSDGMSGVYRISGSRVRCILWAVLKMRKTAACGCNRGRSTRHVVLGNYFVTVDNCSLWNMGMDLWTGTQWQYSEWHNSHHENVRFSKSTGFW